MGLSLFSIPQEKHLLSLAGRSNDREYLLSNPAIRRGSPLQVVDQPKQPNRQAIGSDDRYRTLGSSRE